MPPASWCGEKAIIKGPLEEEKSQNVGAEMFLLFLLNFSKKSIGFKTLEVVGQDLRVVFSLK